jgi:hypothetical protein
LPTELPIRSHHSPQVTNPTLCPRRFASTNREAPEGYPHPRWQWVPCVRDSCSADSHTRLGYRNVRTVIRECRRRKSSPACVGFTSTRATRSTVGPSRPRSSALQSRPRAYADRVCASSCPRSRRTGRFSGRRVRPGGSEPEPAPSSSRAITSYRESGCRRSRSCRWRGCPLGCRLDGQARGGCRVRVVRDGRMVLRGADQSIRPRQSGTTSR